MKKKGIENKVQRKLRKIWIIRQTKQVLMEEEADVFKSKYIPKFLN